MAAIVDAVRRNSDRAGLLVKSNIKYQRTHIHEEMTRGLLNLVPISADFGPDRRNIEITIKF